MPGPGLAGKAALKTIKPGLRQSDFRDQHQHLAPQPQSLGHGLEIHFGLAGAGHAFQQQHREFTRCHRRCQLLRGCRLTIA